MKRVIVLRPEPGASATVERARARGLEALALPLFELRPVDWSPPETTGLDGLLLTSANAVRCGGEALRALRGIPVYAVGAATANAARKAGFDVASVGEAGVERLLDSIDPNLRLLHLAGAHRKCAPDTRQTIERLTVYDSSALDNVSLDDTANGVALIHSPRAGQRFAELAKPARVDTSSITIAAISREAGEATGTGWREVAVAVSPTDEALLALTERLCNTRPST